VRRLLVVAGAFVLVLGAVAGGAFYYFYDRATAIDRSTPQVVVDQFLDATLVLKDPDRTSLLICDRWSAAQAMTSVGAPSDPRVSVTWGDPIATVTGASATVSVNVFFRATAGEDIETWTLILENQDGWRVCDLTKESSLDP
jgi:hypothetical protein